MYGYFANAPLQLKNGSLKYKLPQNYRYQNYILPSFLSKPIFPFHGHNRCNGRFRFRFCNNAPEADVRW